MRWDNVVKLLVILAAAAFAGVLAFKPVFSNLPWLPLSKDVKLGLDLRGGVHVVLQAQDTPEAKVTQDSMNKAIAILRNRIDQFGVTEPIIQQQGDRRIIVEIAGGKDPDEMVRTLIKAAFLEFKTEDGKTVLTGKHLVDAQDALNPQSGEAEVNLTFDKEGTKIFADVTSANVGRPIGIYLDGQLLQNPVVREPIREGKAQITGYANLDEAHRIAVLLRSGALPVKLEVIEKRTVGPTLGADSLHRSINAGILGFAVIALFMIAYYRVPGLIANLALWIYALIMLAVFVAFKVTLTLPGIAGFLLSLAVAIDANIIIFERLKEELRAGRTLRSAIDVGFKRAFVAIFDANLTTVIAAVVLYYFGTGPIKGFAVTLTIGIAVSMFTAITMTRSLLHLTAGTGLIKNTKLYGA
ncbi:MAG: protein translocase subunit SecD [Bacillota bacterium]